ncbi:MAG: DUF2252 domain-containing protein, partial [Candidatus Electrothrix sp. ATG2]|nr:DUF2252 domain-containing protein [Candidatus Electrothrix sp. ATG2]
MSVSRKKTVISELKKYNKEIKKDIRYDKYCKMAATPYAFYRGTDHLYWRDFSKDRGSKKFSTLKTRTWLQGDLHAYNFGTFKNDKGELVYGLNDFDEAVISDYQYDVWRMAVSLILIARENGKSAKSDEKKFVATFADSYLKQLKILSKNNKGEKIAYTSKQAGSPLKEFMKIIEGKKTKTREKMLEKWTTKGRFNTSLEKL